MRMRTLTDYTHNYIKGELRATKRSNSEVRKREAAMATEAEDVAVTGGDGPTPASEGATAADVGVGG